IDRSALYRPFPYTTLFRSHSSVFTVSALHFHIIDNVGDIRPDYHIKIVHAKHSEEYDHQVQICILNFQEAKQNVNQTGYQHSDRSEEHTSELQSRFDLVSG